MTSGQRGLEGGGAGLSNQEDEKRETLGIPKVEWRCRLTSKPCLDRTRKSLNRKSACFEAVGGRSTAGRGTFEERGAV